MTNLGEKFQQLLVQIEQDERTRKDIILPVNELRMNEQGLMKSAFFGELELGDAATSQLCAGLRLPTTYMKRLQNERPDLVAHQVNHFLQTQQNLGMKKVRIKNNRIQGFVGENYVPFDNMQFLDVFQNTVQNLSGLNVQHYHMNDRKFHMRLVFENSEYIMGNDMRDYKDKLYIGFDLENSEIGFRSIKLTPCIWRLVCSNGLRRIYAKGEVLKQRHSNFDVGDLKRRMVASIKDSAVSGKEMIEVLEKSRNVKVLDPMAKIEELATEFGIRKKRMELIKSNFQYDAENSIYGVINAFTRTARNLKDNEQRLELETVASRILTAV